MFLLSVHDLSSQVDLCKLLPLDSCEQHLEKRMQQCQSWWLFFDSWPRAAVRTKGSDDAPAGASGISKPHISSAHRERRRAWCVCRLAVCDVHIWDSSAAWDQARLLKKKKKKVICKVAVFVLWRSCETYCKKRWGVELRHFPWQPYENNQAEGQWRQRDAAKPYSLSACLLRSASQLAVFPFRFLVNSCRASFITLVYFLLLSLSLFSLAAPGSLNRMRLHRCEFRAVFWATDDDAGLKWWFVTSEQQPPLISLHAYAAAQGHSWNLSG